MHSLLLKIGKKIANKHYSEVTLINISKSLESNFDFFLSHLGIHNMHNVCVSFSFHS